MRCIFIVDAVILDADYANIRPSRYEFWFDVFKKNFLDIPDDPNKDDMLFFVRKSDKGSKTTFRQVCYIIYILIGLEYLGFMYILNIIIK